jgi:hypothetical protein
MVVPVIWMTAAGVVVRAIRVSMIVVVVVSVDRPMIMVVMVIMIMTVVVRVRGAVLGLRIGAAFRIERRFERDHAGAKTLGHRLDDGIAADAQRLWLYFSRQMPVAEVPGDASQDQRVGGPDFHQRFGLGDHLDHAPVLEPQPVAAAQHRRFRKIEQEFEPADAGHGDTPAVTRVEVEHHTLRRRARPVASRDDFISAQHHCTFRGLGGRVIGDRFAFTSLNETRSKRQPACKPGSVWPGLIAPT